MTPDRERAQEAPPSFLSEPIEAYLAPLIEDLASYETRASIPPALATALGNRYAFQRELGHGGMATVYLAFDKALERPVAVKVLSAPLAGSLNGERFIREVEVTTSLKHERIVPVHDSGAVDGLLYYAMRYFEGGSLRERIARAGPLSIASTVAIARDIAAALDFAHAHGIVHRDIKPANILLDGDTAFVADFGIARLVDAAGRDQLTQTGAVLGTARYMSPEQAGSEKNIDARSDIYSLGCVVFEMLAGDPPFTGSSARNVLARQMHERPPQLSILRPTVTHELEQVVERALAKQPADRFQSAREFVDELSRAVSGVGARHRGLRKYSAVAGAFGLFMLMSAWLVRTIAAPTPSHTDAPRRIAVLYFDDLTTDRRLPHVAAGLTEDLIDELSQVRGLRVVSSTGVRMLRDSSLSPEQLARRFNVGTLITGSIASSPSLMRLTVRLIDAGGGTQLNSRTWERPPWDLLTLQDSLSTEVALWLRERLGANIRPREQRRATRSVEAWDAVQRGEVLLSQGSAFIRSSDPRAREVLLRADSAFAIAAQHDARWVMTAVGRARTALALAFAERNASVPRELDSSFTGGFRRAIARANEALEVTPGASEALAVRGEARLRLALFGVPHERPTELALAEEDLRQAVSARPDLADAWSMLGEVYYHQARFAEAADAQSTAYQSDAFLTGVRSLVNSLFLSNLYAERFDEARKWCAIGKARYRDDPRFVGCELMLVGATGRRREDATTAWRIISQIERDDTVGMHAATWSFNRMMAAAVLARAGLRDSARLVVERTAAERGKRPAAKPAEAYVRVLLGDRVGALEILRHRVAAEPHTRRWISRMPWYRALRDDPAFRDLIREPSPSVPASGRP